VSDSPSFHFFESAGAVIHLPAPLTKFLLFITIAAVIVTVTMLWVARKIQSGHIPKGKLWNFVETLIFFVRDKIAKPAIGDEADKYLPFLTTLFLFIFLCNLFGIFPFLPSPTAHIYVTGALAAVVFVIVHTGGIMEHGGKGYLKTFIPHVHLEGGTGMKIF